MMSDFDDDYELPPLQLTKFTCSKEKKIVLDLSATLVQRQKDADLDAKIAELTKDTESRSSYSDGSSSSDPSIQAFIQELKQPMIQLIKGSHPYRTTFISEEIGCLFNQDYLSIQDFRFPHDPFVDSLHRMSSHELHEHICRHELKRPFYSGAVLHPLCQYLFVLMSVHRDERTVHASSSTLHYIKEEWYPSLDIIFSVFINWGINPELLNKCDIEVDKDFPLKLNKKLVSSPRFEDINVQKVLELINSVAAALARESSQDKLNKLLQVLVLSALDEGFKSPFLQSCFSRCISELLNAIPESQWNEQRVWTVCQMLHRNGTEHFHNQAVVCCSLLIVSPRSIEIAKALAFATLNHMLATELKAEPLDSIADTSITELLRYYHPLKTRNSYVLYIVIKLVDFCLLRAYIEDNLNLYIIQRKHMTTVIEEMDRNKRAAPENRSGIFKNCYIHVLPLGLGKKRMSLFQTQIANQGGICVSKLSANSCNLTHIVLEDSIIKDSGRCVKLLRGMHVDINEAAVKVVGTQWLSNCLKECMYVDTKEFELSPVTKRAGEIDTQCDTEPLRKEDCTVGVEEPDSVKHDLPTFTVQHLPPKKFKPDIKKSPSELGAESEHNCLVIAELQKLASAFRRSGDQWRAYGYEKAIKAISAYGSEIKSYEEAISIPGVGSKIAAKMSEFLTSGQLRKVDEICSSERSQVVELFSKVWGAGPTTTHSWYQQGFRTLEDLKTKANLTMQQRIGLKHFDDIQGRMPREEVEKIAAVVKKAALSTEPMLNVELCGSYRRGKTTCGDVDILITKPDDMSADILSRLIAQLRESGFITDDLVKIEVNRNQKKYLGICRLPGENQKHRRLDIFVVPQSEYATALMHYTGSALFNRSIRLLANRKGMRLSEHSLLSGIVREGKDILNDGYIMSTPTEESIFGFLEIEYRPPEERDHQL